MQIRYIAATSCLLIFICTLDKDILIFDIFYPGIDFLSFPCCLTQAVTCAMFIGCNGIHEHVR